MAHKIVTFGEILLRLSPTNHKTVQQSHSMEFFFGGTELNVGASLSNFGCDVHHVSAVTNDFVGNAALAYVKSFGVITQQIQKNEHPIGQYILEVGSEIRPSRISYNRLNGSFANINPEIIDWESILDDCTYFHWTGITPGISEKAYIALKQGLEIANQKGIQITTDPAYRSNLWKYGKDGKDVLRELVGLSTIFIGGVNEINEILGTDFSQDQFIEASQQLKQELPSIQKVFDKIRIAPTASKQITKGRAWSNETYFETSEIQVDSAVDRIGTGDAFAAGLIYGLLHYDELKALEFANAACAIKHTYLGDINLAMVDEVLEIMNGNLGGRIKR